MLVFIERQNGVMIKTLIFGVQHIRLASHLYHLVAVVILGKLFNFSEPQCPHL